MYRTGMSVATVWGADGAERAAAYPCDEVVPAPAESLFRAVTVRASRPVLYRWLCQLRVAPYSYDLIDNGGRRSPRTLTPDLEPPATGQRWMRIFTLVDFTPEEQLTFTMTAPKAVAMFGAVTLTYALRDAGPATTRLVVKLNLGERGDSLPHRLRRRALAWGDLVMMHRQLTNLRRLAEATEVRKLYP
jgi:hypothetical protein